MKKTILIVDDDQYALRILETMLVEAGYDVIKSLNGKDAIRMARTQQPHLILFDVKMPELDGDKAADILKNDPATRDIPIAYQTCLVKKDQIENGFVKGSKIGNLNFVAKPYNRDQLLEIVNRTIR